MSDNERKLTVYVPPDLRAAMTILPARSISRICQQALWKAIEQAQGERAEAITEMFEED